MGDRWSDIWPAVRMELQDGGAGEKTTRTAGRDAGDGWYRNLGVLGFLGDCNRDTHCPIVLWGTAWSFVGEKNCLSLSL